MELNKNKNLEAIIKIINQFLDVDNILCFAKQSDTLVMDNFLKRDKEIVRINVRYYLLIISQSDVKDILHLQETVNSQLDPDSNVYLMIHTPEEIANALVQNNRFFQTIFKRAAELGFNSRFKPCFDENPNSVNRDASAIWHEYYHKAIVYQESASNLLGIDDNAASLCLIIESLEHACLGLLLSCLDYNPKQHNLSYLLPLCDILSEQFECVIPRKTPEDKANLCLLSSGKKNNSLTLSDDPLNVFFLNQRCIEFLKVARKVFESAFNNQLQV